MKRFIPFLFLLLATKLFAIEAPKNQQSYCKVVRETNFFRNLIQEKENRLSFRNHGGLLNSGVCWWHSRFTRNALYLGIWRPDLKKPDFEGRKKLIKKIRRATSVITIPGYKNLEELSVDNSDLIQKELESWQKVDGVFKNRWFDGVLGPTRLPKQMFKWHMDRIYKHFKGNDDVVFLRAQIKGISAHSLLLVDMKKEGPGYIMTVIDSNYRYPYKIEYKYGMRYLTYFNKRYIPYLQFRPELEKLKLLQKYYCYSKRR